MPDEDGIKRRLLESWKEEIQAAATYNRLAQREPDPNRRRILRELADTEDRHAGKWASRLAELGVEVPARESVHLPRGLDLSLRFAPIDAIVAHQEAEERRLSADHAELTGDEATDRLLAEISAEDAEHAGTLRALMRGHPIASPRGPQMQLDRMLRLETWHRHGGGWIGGAIYGVNDGLAAVFGIVSFTASATNGGHVVLIAGVAGALASAVSMGAGAYLATKSEAEVYEAEIARERREVEEDPAEEREELELFYRLKGLNEREAKLLADRVAQDPKRMLEEMAQEELGLGANVGGQPIQAAAAALVSTGVGAIVPVVPFIFSSGLNAMIMAAGISILAHFAVGAAKAFVTLRAWWASGLEMTALGILVGAVTYVVGLLFHVS